METISRTNTPITPAEAPEAPDAARKPERFLRAVLTVNALSSAAIGVAGLVAAAWWAERIGLDNGLPVSLVSGFLLVFAAGVLLVARSGRDRLRLGAAAVSAADFTWVAATAAVIAAGTLNGVGITLGVVMAVAVLDYGLLQLRFRSRLQVV
jgi:hypothetical protein